MQTDKGELGYIKYYNCCKHSQLWKLAKMWMKVGKVGQTGLVISSSENSVIWPVQMNKVGILG